MEGRAFPLFLVFSLNFSGLIASPIILVFTWGGFGCIQDKKTNRVVPYNSSDASAAGFDMATLVSLLSEASPYAYFDPAEAMDLQLELGKAGSIPYRCSQRPRLAAPRPLFFFLSFE